MSPVQAALAPLPFLGLTGWVVWRKASSAVRLGPVLPPPPPILPFLQGSRK